MAELVNRITADASGVAAGTEQAAASITSLRGPVEQLQVAFDGLGTQAVAAFKSSAVAAKEATEQVTGMLGPIQAMRDMLGSVGEALIAAFAVHELIDFAGGMAKTAQDTQHAATTFGLATTEVQRLRAEAAGVGAPFEAVTTAMMRMDRAITTAREGSKQTSEAFKVLGVDIHSSADNMTLFNEAIAGLANVEDVPTRVGLAMQLFGRNIQSIAPLIDLTKEQLAALNAEIDNSGAVDAKAQAAGEQLAQAMNANQIAMMGLHNVMTEALAPAFTAILQDITPLIVGFVRSYQEGGQAKVIMDALAISLRTLAAAALALVAALTLLVGGLTQAIDLLMGFGLAVGGQFQAAMAKVKQATDAGRESVAAFNVELREAISLMAGIGAPGPPAAPQASPKGGGIPEGLGGAHKAKAGGKDQMEKLREQLEELENSTRASTQQWLGDMDALQQTFWENALTHAKKGSSEYIAIEKELAQLDLKTHRDAAEDKLKEDKDAIGDAKGNAAESAAAWAQYLADVSKYYGAGSEAFKQAEYEKARAAKEAAKEALAAAITAAKEGADAAVKAANDQLAATKATIADEIAAVKGREQDKVISVAQATVQIIALLNQQLAAEKLNALEKYQAEASADDQIEQRAGFGTAAWLKALMDRYGAWVQYNNNLVTVNAQTDKQIEAANADATAKFNQQWQTVKSTFDRLGNQFASTINDLVNRTKSWSQVWQSVLGTMQLDLIKFGVNIVANWAANIAKQELASAQGQAAILAINNTLIGKLLALGGIDLANFVRVQVSKTAAAATAQAAQTTAKTASEAAGLAAATTTAAAQKALNITMAFSGGAASMAAAPFPLDMTAPAFAAQMAALASAAEGFDVPAGINPITRLHAQEMVLPANLAQGIRAMATQAASGEGGGFGGGGDTHIAFHMGPGSDGPAMQRWFNAHGQQIVQTLQRQTRRGGNLFATPA